MKKVKALWNHSDGKQLRRIGDIYSLKNVDYETLLEKGVVELIEEETEETEEAEEETGEAGD